MPTGASLNSWGLENDQEMLIVFSQFSGRNFFQAQSCIGFFPFPVSISTVTHPCSLGPPFSKLLVPKSDTDSTFNLSISV